MLGRMGNIWDVAVVGGGPGGMQAAIAAASEGLSVVVIEKHQIGGQIGQTPKLENSVFADGGMTGPMFALMMKEQATRMGVVVESGEVIALSHCGGIKTLDLRRGEMIHARTVVLAMGNKWTELDIPGLRSVLNKQAFIGPAKAFDWDAGGRPVMVYGGGPAAGQAILALADSAGTSVCYSLSRSGLKMPQYLVDRMMRDKKVLILPPATLTSVVRWEKSGGLLVDALPAFYPFHVNALFLCNGLTPNTDWVGDTLDRDEGGRIVVKDLHTSMPGVFAIGDCRAGSTPRVGVAIGDGSMVVTCIWGYLRDTGKPVQ